MNEFKRNIPQKILDKDFLDGNEFGCRKSDFEEVINLARKNSLAIIGGQVQYALPDAICELYWVSYDPEERKATESWKTYCERSAKECLEKFHSIIRKDDIQQQALEGFKVLKEKRNAGINIDEFQTFIIYFEFEK